MMMSEPPTTDGGKVEFCGVGYHDYSDASCLEKQPVHADNCSVAVTDKLKASSHPVSRLV